MLGRRDKPQNNTRKAEKAGGAVAGTLRSQAGPDKVKRGMTGGLLFLTSRHYAPCSNPRLATLFSLPLVICFPFCPNPLSIRNGVKTSLYPVVSGWSDIVPAERYLLKCVRNDICLLVLFPLSYVDSLACG